MRPAKLSDLEIDARLSEVPLWHRENDSIARLFTRTSFSEAIAFVVRIGFLAEAADHHPDIDIRYRRVTVVLATHDADGLTDLDFQLAAQIDDIA